MWPYSEHPRPIPSFQRPVVPPTVDPDTDPQISVHFNPEWLPYVLGALKQLVLQSTWDVSSADDLALAQQRAMTLLSMFGAASQRPFFQDEEEAGDDTLPDYPWYEKVEDWIISVFLAICATPGAAIVYRATIPKIRLAFRTGNLGTIFKILIDGLEFITGDNYSPIKQLVEHVVDVQDFATQHSLGSGPHMIKIVNVGRTSGPGGNLLEVVRGDIRPEVAMFDIRWDGCNLQKTTDGTTWVDVGDITTCATSIADSEIASRIHFRENGMELDASLDNGATYPVIYDPTNTVKSLADDEIAAKVRFNQSGIKLQDSLTGGAPFSDIYDPTDQVKALADSEIEAQISFTQDGPQLYASTNGATSHSIFDLTGLIPADTNNLVPPPWQSRPAPGASKSFDLICRAGQHVLLPCYVLAGDSVTVSNITGAWADASLATGSGSDHAPTWYRPDGFVYDTGLPSPTDGTFGVPTMALIARSDGSSEIPVYDGEAHTLDYPAELGRMWFLAAHVMNFQEAYPAGIGTPPDYYRVNQLDVSGYAAFRVTVTNGQPETWTHTFDFTISDYGWTSFEDDSNGQHWVWATWVAGQGWHMVGAAGNGPLIISPQISGSVLQVEEYLSAANSSDNPGGFTNVDGNFADLISGSANYYDHHVTWTLTNQHIRCGHGDSVSRSGNAQYITRITLSGNGTDPFI